MAIATFLNFLSGEVSSTDCAIVSKPDIKKGTITTMAIIPPKSEE